MWTRELTLTAFAFLFLLVYFDAAPGQSGGKSSNYISLIPEMINRELTTIDGRHLRLSDYKNKVIVLNLFAPWCAPCRENIWELNRLRKRYKKQVQVIGLVTQVNDPQKSTSSFAGQLKIKFPVIWDDVGFSESLSRLVNGLSVLPQTFVIDRYYHIRKHFMGFSAANTPPLLRQAINEVRRERETKKPTASS